MTFIMKLMEWSEGANSDSFTREFLMRCLKKNSNLYQAIAIYNLFNSPWREHV